MTESTPAVPTSPTLFERTLDTLEDGGAVISTTNSYDSMAFGAHHFLLCLDPGDTDASKRALEYTKDRVAKAGDLVVLLSVTSPPAPLANGASVFESETHRLELKEQLKSLEQIRLLDASKGFQPNVRVKCRAVLAQASGVQAIVETIQREADADRCEVIIVGRRKRNAFKRWVGSGSISTALLTNTDYTVLVVR